MTNIDDDDDGGDDGYNTNCPFRSFAETRQ